MCKSWSEFFESIKDKPYVNEIRSFLDEEYIKYEVYPARDKILNAFLLTPLDKVKVVIVGQDPYHEPNQAMGLAFSVPSNMMLPPSLKNIYKEIENNFALKMKKDGDLTYLATQGVLLLNTILTVRRGNPLSHKNIGYQKLIKDVFDVINKQSQPIVFLLWGTQAKKLKQYLNNPEHLILESNHPSPLSANRGGFFNQNHFKKANEFLKENNKEPIKWNN